MAGRGRAAQRVGPWLGGGAGAGLRWCCVLMTNMQVLVAPGTACLPIAGLLGIGWMQAHQTLYVNLESLRRWSLGLRFELQLDS